MGKKKQDRRRVPPAWYSNRELLHEADWLWWVTEYQLAWDTMWIIAWKVTAEHDEWSKKEGRYEPQLERQIEEGPEQPDVPATGKLVNQE